MEKYLEQKFVGERALYKKENLQVSYCTFDEGESPFKECSNLEIDNSQFKWKYPLWYCSRVNVEDCTMFEMARAGVWYSENLHFKNVTYEAPKGFRKCKNLNIENVTMQNAQETLWNCREVSLKDVTVKGDYFAMGSSDIEIENLTLVGNYSFDSVKNVIVRNAKMLTKDAFWNSENITIYDSYIAGEYFGWNSKNITLVNCTIDSEQGLCYMENVVLKNCKLLNTNLAFEYSTVDADINGSIDSIKNPISGRIVADEIGEIIFDNLDVDKNNTVIELLEDKVTMFAKCCK